MAEMPRRLTMEDLEAMRKEFGAGARDDAGLPYNVRDDLRQIQQAAQLGVNLEDWAIARGVPPEYAAALRRYLEQD